MDIIHCSGNLDSKLTDVNELSVKNMDTLLLLSCYSAKGKSNFAENMANRMNTNYLMASDGETMMTNLFGAFTISTTKDPFGFKVYKKHYPNESNVFWQSKPEVTVRQMTGDALYSYSGLAAFMKAAGVTKP